MAGNDVGGVDDHPARQDAHQRIGGVGEDYGGVSEQICRVIRAIRGGANSIDAIAAATGLSVERVRGIIGVLLAHGYVREARGQCRCPLRRVCPLARLRERLLKTYVVVKEPPWCKS